MNSDWNEKKRTGNAAPMKEVFDKLLRAYQWDKKFTELDVLDKWEEMMGKAVALRTTKLKIHLPYNGVFEVEKESTKK